MEELLLGDGEQANTPGNGGMHGLLTCRAVGSATCQRSEKAVRQAVVQHDRREGVAAGGGQFDRERQPVELAADSGDGGRIVIGKGEAWMDGLGAGHEQPDRVGPGKVGRWLVVVRYGKGQG